MASLSDLMAQSEAQQGAPADKPPSLSQLMKQSAASAQPPSLSSLMRQSEDVAQPPAPMAPSTPPVGMVESSDQSDMPPSGNRLVGPPAATIPGIAQIGQLDAAGGGPPITREVVPQQTAPKQFTLGAMVHDFIESQPIVKEYRGEERTAQGAKFINDVAHQIAPSFPTVPSDTFDYMPAARMGVQAFENIPRGFASLGDSAINGANMVSDTVAPGFDPQNIVIQNLMHPPKLDLVKHYDEMINKNGELPAARDFGTGIGEFGGIAGKMNGLKALTKGSAQVGGLNAWLGATQRYDKDHTPGSPAQIGGDFASGFAGNFIGTGGLNVLFKSPKFAGQIVSGIVKKFQKLSPAQREIAAAAAQKNGLPIEQFMQNIGANQAELSDDVQAAVQHIKQQQLIEQGLHQPVAPPPSPAAVPAMPRPAGSLPTPVVRKDPFLSSLDEIRSATPETVHTAIAKATAEAKKATSGGYTKRGKKLFRDQIDTAVQHYEGIQQALKQESIANAPSQANGVDMGYSAPLTPEQAAKRQRAADYMQTMKGAVTTTPEEQAAFNQEQADKAKYPNHDRWFNEGSTAGGGAHAEYQWTSKNLTHDELHQLNDHYTQRSVTADAQPLDLTKAKATGEEIQRRAQNIDKINDPKILQGMIEHADKYTPEQIDAVSKRWEQLATAPDGALGNMVDSAVNATATDAPGAVKQWAENLTGQPVNLGKRYPGAYWPRKTPLTQRFNQGSNGAVVVHYPSELDAQLVSHSAGLGKGRSVAEHIAEAEHLGNVLDVDQETATKLASEYHKYIKAQVSQFAKVADTEDYYAPSFKKFMKDRTPPPASEPAPGDFRRTTTQEFHGRNKNKKAEPLQGHAYLDTPEMNEHVNRIAQTKVINDYYTEKLDNLKKQIWNKFADPNGTVLNLPNGLTIEAKDIKARRSPENQLIYDMKREDMATTPRPPKRQAIEAVTTKEFGTGSQDAAIKYVQADNNIAKAADQLATLKKHASGAKKLYEDAKAMPGAVETFTKAEQEGIARSGDLTKAMHVRVYGPQHPPIETAVLFRKGALVHDFPNAKTQAEFDAFAAALDAGDANRAPKRQLTITGKARVSAAVAAASSAFHATQAQAADTVLRVQNVAMSPDFLAAFNTNPLPETMGIGFLISTSHLVAKSLLKNGGRMYQLGAMWRDSMDHVAHSDWMLRNNPLAPPQAALQLTIPGMPKAAPRALASEIWNHAGQVLKASWGVNFDEGVKAEAINALRTGSVKPIDALRGADVFADLTQKQRNALVMWKIAQDNLGRLIRQRIADLKEYKVQNVDAKKFGHNEVDSDISVMSHMLEQLSPASQSKNFIDKAGTYLINNWMESQFLWNPEFHGTNLTDAFIAGGSYVGSKNIWAAHKAFAMDAEVKALFHDSNLNTGGIKQERINAALKAADAKGRLKMFDKDLPSDLINADRVFYAHLLQKAQIMRAAGQLQKLGFTGKDHDFAKSILRGDFPHPEIIADAWAEGAEKLSRTLGVDLYQINTNMAQRSPLFRSMTVFTKQPARISRLAMQYLANGQFGRLFTMLGYTLTLGGRAAIPSDLLAFVSVFNATSAFKASSFADALNLWSLASGQSLSPKLTWDIFWLRQGVMNPLTQIVDTASKAYDDPIKGGKAMLPYAASRVLGVPLGPVMRGEKAVEDVMAGERKLHASDGLGRLIGTETAPLNSWFDKARHLTSPLIPGVDREQDVYNQAMNEEKNRARFGQSVPFGDQYYNENGGDDPWQIWKHGYAPGTHPLEMFFKQR